ncbi:hypothetical protein Tco_1466257 [Tanacetum coccineum]
MTRSLTKKLFTPYEEPKRVLHSTRKLFKTTSLDYSSSPEFDLFSNLEDQCEEEVAEAMGEPTMEEYMTKTRKEPTMMKRLGKYYPPSGTARKIEANGANTKDEWDPANIEIETDIFHFETPLCKAFKEFNYLYQIDVDVLTKDIPGFKTYEEYKDAWSHYSPIDEWKDYEHTTYIETNISSNQNTYNNVCQIIMDHNAGKAKQERFDEHELMGDDDDDIVIIEQRVKVNKKARILELKRRNHEKHCSDNLYAVSLKEDTPYPCPKLQSASTKRRSIRRIQMKPYAVFKYKSWNILEYNNRGAHAKKPQYVVLKVLTKFQTL